jgi:hypothetical protein
MGSRGRDVGRGSTGTCERGLDRRRPWPPGPIHLDRPRIQPPPAQRRQVGEQHPLPRIIPDNRAPNRQIRDPAPIVCRLVHGWSVVLTPAESGAVRLAVSLWSVRCAVVLRQNSVNGTFADRAQDFMSGAQRATSAMPHLWSLGFGCFTGHRGRRCRMGWKGIGPPPPWYRPSRRPLDAVDDAARHRDVDAATSAYTRTMRGGWAKSRWASRSSRAPPPRPIAARWPAHRQSCSAAPRSP